MVLLIFIAGNIKLKVLVTGSMICRIPQVEAMMQIKSECDVHWHIYLAIGLLLQIALWLIWQKLEIPKPWQRKLFTNTVHIYVFFG